jgi:hypothetical protein
LETLCTVQNHIAWLPLTAISASRKLRKVEAWPCVPGLAIHGWRRSTPGIALAIK